MQAYGIVTGSTASIHLALAIFGVFCVLLGGLIVASNFIPRILGLFLIVAGIGWLTFPLQNLGSVLTRYTEGLGGVAELALMLWLLMVGVPASLPKRDRAR